MARFIELNRPLVHVRNYFCEKIIRGEILRAARRGDPLLCRARHAALPRLILFNKYLFINIRLSRVTLSAMNYVQSEDRVNDA